MRESVKKPAFSTTGVASSGHSVFPPVMSDIKITVHTTAGDISATLYASKAPLTCANFLNLARRGYYDGVAFHRVIEGFMLQGGDPTETGRGGRG